MADIGDPGFYTKLVELLQTRNPFNLPKEISAGPVGITIAIPAELLLERAKPAPVSVVPQNTGDVKYYATRVRLARAAPGVGNFAWVALAVAPISTAELIKRLDLVGFRLHPTIAGQEPGFIFVKWDGHLGAAPAAPNGTMRRLYKEGVSQLSTDSVQTARTSSTGFGANDEATGNFAVNERILEFKGLLGSFGTVSWPRGGGDAIGGMSHTPDSISRLIDRNQPHLCGLVIGCVSPAANVALDVDFEVVVREAY